LPNTKAKDLLDNEKKARGKLFILYETLVLYRNKDHYLLFIKSQLFLISCVVYILINVTS
jgi:hypothetical protein